ncbi:MAG: HDOD domain-containing protein [Candidatus Eisenbacteria sp.]|nr:HDOD domain-containing protein [Candidatus Eisenbacteria bacterium]
MQLGRTHRAQVQIPIHFFAPDRSKTYIGKTIDISSNGFSVQVRTDDPLPTIIVGGILPTEVAGDEILCKARVIWQGGLAGGLKRASYKITSIAQKSQDRLDQLIQESVSNLIAELQGLPLFADCPREAIENLLHLARSRELPPDSLLYEGPSPQGIGLFLILEGDVSPVEPPGSTDIFGPGSVVGQWTDPEMPPQPAAVKTGPVVRILHIPISLLQEAEQEIPAIADSLRKALGHPVARDASEPSRPRRRKLGLNLLNELQEIPTLPVVFNAVMDCVEDPDATSKDLARIIRKDQALVTRVLKTVNSALYGFGRQISSAEEAVILLGMNQTANLAVTAMLLNSLVDPRHPERRPEGLWEHSLGTAYIAQAIGETLQGKVGAASRWATASARTSARGAQEKTAISPAGAPAAQMEQSPPTPQDMSAPSVSRLPIAIDKLFTCAIVHDIGLLILYVRFPKHFAIVREAISKLGSFHRAERELIDMDHCQLGHRIAQAWRLPEPLPTVIAEHHLPQIWAAEIKEPERLLELLREDPVVTLISLADLMARQSGIGLQLDEEPPAIPEAFLEALGLTEEDAGEILSEGAMIKEKVELFFRGMTA